MFQLYPLGFESAKWRAQRAHVPYVSYVPRRPTCPTCSRAQVYFTDQKIKNIGLMKSNEGSFTGVFKGPEF